MKRKSNFRKCILISLVSLFIISLFFGIHSSLRNSNILTNPTADAQDTFPINEPLKTSNSIPKAEWWNVSFQFRNQLNITNQYDYDLKNYSVSFQFNYTELVSEGKIANTLKDLRIVQNGSLLNYYYTKDSPIKDIATVWFKSNVSANSSNYDIYMYYGNNTVGRAENYYDNESFGMAWYAFEDFNSPIAKDFMGRNNANIYDVGDKVKYVAGYMGNYALDFSDSQTEAYIDVPYSTFTGLSDFTICFWATPGVNGEYLISGSDGSNHNDMIMRSPTAIGWHFYVWMRNDSIGHIYTDLVQTDNLIWNYPNGNPDDPVDIANGGFIWAQEQDSLGGGFVASQAFSGSIDEIRIFNHGLSTTELIWLFNNYTLDVSLLEQEVRSTELTIYIKDVDGGLVPGAKVSIFNESNILYTPDEGYFSDNTTANGIVIFSGIPFGTFNITVNYTSTEGLTEIVNITFDYDMTQVQQNLTIYTTLWTINFNITDIDNQPMEQGWVLVSNNSAPYQLISNISVNNSGIAVFRWLNQTVTDWYLPTLENPYEYNYTVYYNNSPYTESPLVVNWSTVQNIIPHPDTVDIRTNLTTLNLKLYDSETFSPLVNAKIHIKDNRTGSLQSLVNLTTNNSGQAVFRWRNSSTIQHNYSLSIQFYEDDKSFNVTNDQLNKAEIFNFTLQSLTSFTFNVTLNPANFKTELIPKNPSLLTIAYIGYDVEFYVLFNITDNPGGTEGLAWADSVTWILKQGTATLNVGSFEKVQNSQFSKGLYFLSLNTIKEGINDSSKIYNLQVSASKTGFGEPQNIYYTISVQKVLTQLEANRDLNTPIIKYWKEELNVLFTYKGDITEQTEIVDSYPRNVNQSSINLDPFITSFTNYWNLTGLYFNFTNIYESGSTQWPNAIAMNITYNSQKYPVINGTTKGSGYTNLTRDQLNWHQNLYQFGVESSPALDNYSVDVTAYFERWYTTSKIVIDSSEITQGILTIDTPSDDRNLVYIKFEFARIKNTSGVIVNASDVLLNVTIPGYGDVLNVQDTVRNGDGILELSNYTLFPVDSTINFIINSTNLQNYTINITAGFESTFEKQDKLEKTQTSYSYPLQLPTSKINISEPVDSWNLTRLYIAFSNLNETVLNKSFYPSQANMSIWYNGNNYIVQDDEINGTGYAIIPLINEIGNRTFVITISANLSNNFTYDAQFHRAYQNQKLTPLSDASVTWSYLAMSGEISEVSSGQYNFTLNTSILLPTTETKLINVIAAKQYHQTNSNQYIKLILNERPTLLNNSKRNFYEIQIYVLDQVFISFNYTDEILGTILKTDTRGNVSATFTWYNTQTPSVINNGTLNEIGNYFVLDFNTELREVGKYVLGINIERDNYTQPQMILLLTISQRPVDITVMPPLLSLPQRQTSMIVVSLKDNKLGIPLSNFTLSYSIDGIPLSNLIPQADGSYLLPIDTTSLTLGAHYIIISLDHENYTMPVSTVSLTVSYAQIFGIDEPIFYTIVIAATVAIATVSIYIAVKRARIPYIIKKIDESIKTINKGKGEIKVPVMKSKEHIFQDTFSSDWEILGLETPIKPKKAKAKAIDEFKDLLNSMKSVKMTDKEIENLKLKLNTITKEEAMNLLQSMGIPPDASERLINLAKK